MIDERKRHGCLAAVAPGVVITNQELLEVPKLRVSGCGCTGERTERDTSVSARTAVIYLVRWMPGSHRLEVAYSSTFRSEGGKCQEELEFWTRGSCDMYRFFEPPGSRAI